MIRKVFGIVIGYVVIAAFVFITFSIAYMILGTERSFLPNSCEVSFSWIVVSQILGFAAAILGGLTSIMIGQSRKATMILAGLVLVIGIAVAVPTLSGVDERALVRTGEIGVIDVMRNAHLPAWLAFLNPLIGAAGIILGSRLKSRTRQTAKPVRVEDNQKAFKESKGLGVKFSAVLTDAGTATTAELDDTCGNLVKIACE